MESKASDEATDIQGPRKPKSILAFDGNCGDAMRFYAHVLGGKLGVMTNAQSPFADRCPPEHLNRVIHARLQLAGGAFLYAGDCSPGMPYQGVQGVSLTLNYDSVDKAEQFPTRWRKTAR